MRPQCNNYILLQNLIPYTGIYFFSMENFFALLKGLRHIVKCFSFSMYFGVFPASICVMVLIVIRYLQGISKTMGSPFNHPNVFNRSCAQNPAHIIRDLTKGNGFFWGVYYLSGTRAVYRVAYKGTQQRSQLVTIRKPWAVFLIPVDLPANVLQSLHGYRQSAHLRLGYAKAGPHCIFISPLHIVVKGGHIVDIQRSYVQVLHCYGSLCRIYGRPKGMLQLSGPNNFHQDIGTDILPTSYSVRARFCYLPLTVPIFDTIIYDGFKLFTTGFIFFTLQWMYSMQKRDTTRSCVSTILTFARIQYYNIITKCNVGDIHAMQ
ncbi:pB318L [African swine fever virus]|uniref:PB318L n=1 Tax=African swine fever virus TaxID=10497 RepID=A0A8A1V305_ASF|nr:pB318L [African swine fever virus]